MTSWSVQSNFIFLRMFLSWPKWIYSYNDFYKELIYKWFWDMIDYRRTIWTLRNFALLKSSCTNNNNLIIKHTILFASKIMLQMIFWIKLYFIWCSAWFLKNHFDSFWSGGKIAILNHLVDAWAAQKRKRGWA